MHHVVREKTTCAPQREDIPVAAPGEKEPKKSYTCGLGCCLRGN